MDDLISRQAAIDAIEQLDIPEDMCVFEILSHIELEIGTLPSAQPEQQWIPCSERLPEDDVEVLVTDDAGGVQWLGVDKMMSYEDGSGRFWLISQHPSAWMPLPKPYRGEGGNA